MSTLPLILASTSPTRQKQLAALGLPFTMQSPSCDETPLQDETAPQTAKRLAMIKAKSLANRHPNSLIIGADQVALLNGQQLGKPGSIKKAKTMLASMSGQKVEFHSALYLLNTQTQISHAYIDLTTVYIRQLAQETITRYLEKEPDAIFCAGAAKSEGIGATLIEKIESTDPNALLGLPIFRLVDFLQEEGFQIL